MKTWLDGVAALTAFVAAVFWFLSAYGKVPPLVAYWDQAPDTDPFVMAVKYAAQMNRWAAGFSGVSALCLGLGMVVKR